MRILIFSQYFWPENFQINSIAINLRENGHVVHVLTGKPNYPSGKIYNGYNAFGFNKEFFNKICIFRIPIFPRYNGGRLCLLLNYLSFILSGLFFAPFILKKEKYDIIFVYGTSPIFQSIPASFIGFLKNIPVVLWVQDLWPESLSSTGFIKSKFLLWFVNLFVRFTYKYTDLILVQSKAFIPYISLQTSNTKLIKYHPNSVHNRFYSTLNTKNFSAHKIKSMQSGFTVVFAGNIGEAQSIETIIEAAKKISKFLDIKIIFFGNGSKYIWLKNTIKKEGLENIYLEGSYPEDLMPNILKSASILLVTLKNDDIFKLTIPNKIQAYLAVGRPILGCLDGEGANLIIKARAGTVIPSGDAFGLAEEIVKYYNMNYSKLDKLGLNGKNYFSKHFMIENLNIILIDHFKKLLNKVKLK